MPLVGKFKAANLLREAPVKAPRSWPNSSDSSKSGRNRSAIYLDESAFSPRAEIVNGAGDEFLAGSGFAEDQHGRARGRGQFHLRKGAPQEGLSPIISSKLNSRADFFFEIKLFDGEFVLEGVNFLEGQCIFQRDGHLRRNLLEQFHIRSGKGLGLRLARLMVPNVRPWLRKGHATQRPRTPSSRKKRMTSILKRSNSAAAGNQNLP